MRTEQLTERLREVQFASRLLERHSPVRILLPRDFDANTPLPVLYLLHGGVDDWRCWTDKGAAESVTDGLDVIVVMPDTGMAGWYLDWSHDSETRSGGSSGSRIPRRTARHHR